MTARKTINRSSGAKSTKPKSAPELDEDFTDLELLEPDEEAGIVLAEDAPKPVQVTLIEGAGVQVNIDPEQVGYTVAGIFAGMFSYFFGSGPKQ